MDVAFTTGLAICGKVDGISNGFEICDADSANGFELCFEGSSLTTDANMVRKLMHIVDFVFT
jgi:hypothetical protein